MLQANGSYNLFGVGGNVRAGDLWYGDNSMRFTQTINHRLREEYVVGVADDSHVVAQDFQRYNDFTR